MRSQPISHNRLATCGSKAKAHERESALPAQRGYVDTGNLNCWIEFGVSKKSVGVLQSAKHWPWREVIIMVRQPVNDAEVVVLIAIAARRQQPHEGFHTRGMVVDEPTGHILGLHRFIRTGPRRNGVEFIIKEGNPRLNSRIVLHHIPERLWRLVQVCPVIHAFGIHVLSVAGIGVIGVDINAWRTFTAIESYPSKFASRIRLPAINNFGGWIRLVHRVNKRTQQASVLLRISPGVPVSDVLLIPQSPVVNAVFEVVDHPRYILIERSCLLRRNRRPEHGIGAAVVIVKRSCLRHADIRQLAAARGVHLVSIH